MERGGRAAWRRWAPAAVPAAVAIVALFAESRLHGAIAGGVALIVAAAIAVGVPIQPWLEGSTRRLATSVGRGLMLLVGLVVAVGGAASRMAGIDPLLRRRGWRDLDERAGERRPYQEQRRSGGRLLVRSLVAGLAVVGAATLAMPIGRWVHRGVSEADQLGPDIEFPTWAFPDEAWVDELQAAGWPVSFDPSLGWQNTDVATEHLNVTDGVRRSWVAPSAGDDAPEVWLLGGSTVYGIGQRDTHTVASELARRASAEGRPIRVVNLGVPGYNQWQEVALLGERLSRGERPDLVVLYDGANDLTSMEYRAAEGIEPLAEPPHRFHAAVEAATRYRPEPRSGRSATEPQLRDAFVRVYGAGVDLAHRVAAAYAVPISVVWQPTFASTKPAVHDRALIRTFPFLGAGSLEPARERMAWLAAHLDPRVVDLSGVLDQAGGPVFFDPVHTNELGARLVAEGLWPTVAAQLEDVP